MNKLKELSKKKWFIVLVIVLAIALVGGLGTYAMFYWRSAQNTEITLKIGDIADVKFPEGQELNTNSLAPVFNYTDGETLSFSIENKDTTGALIKYTVNFNITNIDEQLRTTQLKYKLVSGNTTLGEGDFSTATSNSTMKLAEGSLPTGTSNYTLYLYIDSNEENNSNMMNRNITGVVEVTAEDPSKTLAGYIQTLYSSNKDADPVINNNIEYGYASSVNLMNDRLGDALVAEDDGNIRYFGANPNNYIDIGDKTVTETYKGNWEIYDTSGFTQFASSSECYAAYNCKEIWQTYGMSSEEECNTMIENALEGIGAESLSDYCDVTPIPAGTTIPWRIIGVFENKVRIVRDESIGLYSWDTSNTYGNNGVNEWSQADLMKLLNPGYESEEVGGSLWWNSESGNCYNSSNNGITECDFTNSGLSSVSKNYIVDQTIYLGNLNSISISANEAYQKERGEGIINNPADGVNRTLSWTGKVGLIYPSDYGYATDFKKCSNGLDYYYNCSEESWLSSEGWTISPYTTLTAVFYAMSNRFSSDSAAYTRFIHPVLTLREGIERVSGTGTKEDPFKIK